MSSHSIPRLLYFFNGCNQAGLRLRPLRTILRASALASINTKSILRTTNDVIADTRKILNTSTADKDDRVLLQIVSDTGDVSCNFNSVAQANTSNFAKSRIRLLRSDSHNTSANAAFLRARLKRGSFSLVCNRLSTFSNQLINCRHRLFSYLTPVSTTGKIDKTDSIRQANTHRNAIGNSIKFPNTMSMNSTIFIEIQSNSFHCEPAYSSEPALSRNDSSIICSAFFSSRCLSRISCIFSSRSLCASSKSLMSL